MAMHTKLVCGLRSARLRRLRRTPTGRSPVRLRAQGPCAHYAQAVPVCTPCGHRPNTYLVVSVLVLALECGFRDYKPNWYWNVGSSFVPFMPSTETTERQGKALHGKHVSRARDSGVQAKCEVEATSESSTEVSVEKRTPISRAVHEFALRRD